VKATKVNEEFVILSSLCMSNIMMNIHTTDQSVVEEEQSSKVTNEMR